MDDSTEARAGDDVVLRGAPGLRQHPVDVAKRRFDRADVLVALAQAYLRGDQPNRSPVEVTVTIPAASLQLHTAPCCRGEVRQAAEVADPIEVGDMAGTWVALEVVRRLSCDAGVVAIIEDERGTPLSVGRKQRTMTGALKRALYNRDAGCSFPGCTHRSFLEGHHLQHWADGGETSLRNTALLCGHHHRYVHEYGYTAELGPDQRPRFRDSQGRPVAAVPARPAPLDLGWPHIRAANSALEIDAETIGCGWDGTPVDYGAIIGQLLAADGRS